MTNYYRVSIWNTDIADWSVLAPMLQKWLLRQVLRGLDAMGYDRDTSILIERVDGRGELSVEASELTINGQGRMF